MHGLVEGRVDVGPVDEEYVQVVGAQVLEALLHRLQDGDHPTVAALGTLGVANAAFGDDNHVLAPVAQGLPQHDLRLTPPVRRRGVEAVDAKVNRAVHGGVQLRARHVAVGAAHLPASEAEDGNRHVGGAKPSILHAHPPVWFATSVETRRGE